MKIETYIAKQGITIGEFARNLSTPARKVSRNLVYQWVNNIRPVAPKHCWAIETLTGGAVTRPELRPDDWQTLWPDYSPPIPVKSRAPRKVSAASP